MFCWAASGSANSASAAILMIRSISPPVPNLREDLCKTNAGLRRRNLARSRRVSAASAVLGNLARQAQRHDAVLAAVREVNHQTDRHPTEQAQPVIPGKREHQHQTAEHAHDWN